MDNCMTVKVSVRKRWFFDAAMKIICRFPWAFVWIGLDRLAQLLARCGLKVSVG